ncbi:reverse transcriptase domain-containing protein [Tanacetum coccineum]
MLTKCSFGMEEGKFLGYIVTSEGIRAKPEKAKAVMDMPSPKTLKQMQSLSGKLAALNPNEAVSAVLLTKRDRRQMPIHYVSRSLQGAETNYAPMEKLTLALVHAGRQLRRYFQAHPIKVITDSPIGQVLDNSRASGRLAKWSVELGAYGITYVPRVAVKGHFLADFLVDTPTKINVTLEMANNPRVEDIPESSNAREDLTPDPRVKDIHSFVDSKLVASEVEGSYEDKGERMIKYREKVLELVGAFNRFRITHIPRAKNRKADALSKLAAVQFDHLSKEVLVEVLNERSVEPQKVNMVVEEEGPTWKTPIRNYLEKGKLSEDPVDARTLMEKIGNYTMEDEVLYMKSYLVPLMRCVGPLQANYVIREVHMVSCGMYDGPRHVVAKAMNLGYYWPSMHRDAREMIRACDDCQAHASVPRLPKADMISVTSAWPFMKWGMDIVGPLPEGPGRVKYLIVAIDYFTKWMEAKPLATITGKQVVNFTYDNIVCSLPPPGNGAVERANKSLLRGIKTRLEKGGSA